MPVIRTIAPRCYQFQLTGPVSPLSPSKAPSGRLVEFVPLVKQEVGVGWCFKSGRYLIPLTGWPPGQAWKKKKEEKEKKKNWKSEVEGAWSWSLLGTEQLSDPG